MDMQQKLQDMAAAARMAGDTVRSRGEFRVEKKTQQNDYVTEMDVLSETMIREALLGKYPEDGFYGEEGGQTEVKRGRFIVDPIDGTTNFIHGIAPWTVSIAYELDGVIELGCVYAPLTGEMFTAQRGKGAFCGEKLLKVSDEELHMAVVGTSFAHRNPAHNARMLRLFPKMCPRVNDLRRLGSAAYDLCMVAAGRYGAFLELGLNLYDFAAGVLMVQEAGGVVSAWDDDNYRGSGDILAGSPALVKELKEIIAE